MGVLAGQTMSTNKHTLAHSYWRKMSENISSRALTIFTFACILRQWERARDNFREDAMRIEIMYGPGVV